MILKKHNEIRVNLDIELMFSFVKYKSRLSSVDNH